MFLAKCGHATRQSGKMGHFQSSNGFIENSARKCAEKRKWLRPRWTINLDLETNMSRYQTSADSPIFCLLTFSKQMLFQSLYGIPSVVDNNSISSLPLPGLVVNIIALTLPQLQGKALLLPNYYVHTRIGIQDFPVPSTLSVKENIIWWILGQIWFPE